jgi:hypothetical protein
MASQTDSQFPNIPPFPSTVPTAPLLRISLAKLLAHDTKEEERLWNACCDLGFFYLDLRSATGGHANSQTNGHANGANGHANGLTQSTDGEPKNISNEMSNEGLLKDADALFKVAEEFFDLPVEEKVKYDFADEGSYFG